jgi:hypothetical protein
MPIRIKPSHRLSPCVLTLESIKKITELVDQRFSSEVDLVSFSATDGLWEIYGEPRETFLQAISERSELDSFVVEVESEGSMDHLGLVFNEKEAKVTLVAAPQNENWFDHFLLDLKKCLLPPSFAQIVVHVFGQQDFSFDIRLLLLASTINPLRMVSTPYCRIVIQQKPPNPFIENIKANIAANLIWAIALFLLGALFTFVTQHIWGG